MKHTLRIIHPASVPKPHPIVAVECKLTSSRLCFDFSVNSSESPHVNPMLPYKESAWGLWDWDVVEVFVRANSAPTYYEFQVSPLDQFFELEIFEPRVKVNKEFKSGFEHDVLITRFGWQVSMSIPLTAIKWDGREESIRGNAFAILGKTKNYQSIFLPKQEKADFHLPEYFKDFFSLSKPE